MLIPVDAIRVGKRLRKLNEAKLAQLQESIATLGQQSPISVFSTTRFEGGVDAPVFELVAGLHRWEACKRLGLAEVNAIVVELDEIDRELWQIDENLIRGELTQLERAEHHARRKELYELKHPETKHGGDRSSRQLGDSPRYTDDAAAQTGESEREVQRSARRGSKIDDKVKERIRETPIADSGVELDALASMKPEDQRKAVGMVESGKASSVREAKGKIAPPKLRSSNTSEATLEFQRIKKAWDAAGPEAREMFRDHIDGPVFDRTRAA